MNIQFCGAAVGVTGSCHLLTSGESRILLDCGSFQGGSEAEELNRSDFPFDPAEIDAVILSHAHIDHCGRLPLLVKRGYRGPIYATDATAELLDVMLKDSAHIAEQDAEQENRKRKRAGKKEIKPVYDTDDVEKTMTLVRGVTYDTLVDINENIKIVFNDAGHILGSAITEIWISENGVTSKLVYTGDIGMKGRPILQSPKKIKKADYVIMESTYGDRLHDDNEFSVEKLMKTCVSTVLKGGNVVIPSFSVGRTQELIYEFNKVYDGDTPYTKVLKKVPVYVDSPMSTEATEVFKKNAQVYNSDMKNMILSGDHPLEFEGLHFVKTSDESKRLNNDESPKIIISASGMCDAGRVRHHLKHNIWNPKSSIIFVGYQAEGSLGRYILDGAETIKLFGETIAVKADIVNLEGFSGHADRNGLYDWLCGFNEEPRRIFLVHGENEAKVSLRDYIFENKGWRSIAVEGYGSYELPGPDSTVTSEIDSVFLSAEKEFAGKNQKGEVSSRLETAKANAYDIIENTRSLLGGDVTEDELAEIKNSLAGLEKAIYSLGAAVSR